nr:hypothetical protein [Pseudoalteromonas sp. NBT06-2]
MVKDIDYIVTGNSIKLINEFTGRIAEKRRWPDSMQSALESKEGLPVKREGQTLGSITLQHLMCLFKKVSGMTGTAVLAAQEFDQLYQLKACVIPPRKSCIRIDKSDRVFSTKSEKNIAHGQRVLEGENLDRRKALYKYSDLVEQQRQVIHQLRDDILLSDGVHQKAK